MAESPAPGGGGGGARAPGPGICRQNVPPSPDPTSPRLADRNRTPPFHCAPNHPRLVPNHFVSTIFAQIIMTPVNSHRDETDESTKPFSSVAILVQAVCSSMHCCGYRAFRRHYDAGGTTRGRSSRRHWAGWRQRVRELADTGTFPRRRCR